MSTSMHRSDSWSSNKLIKLRTACDRCHTSKVRCSGEKNGCKRCQTLDHDCVYSESRVGKVPGIRRTKRSRTPSERPRSFSPAATEISTRESSKEPIPDPSYFPLYDDSFLAWTAPEKPESYDYDLNETDFLGFDTDSLRPHLSNQPSPNFPAVSDFDLQVPYPSLNIDGLQTPPISNDYDYMPSSYPKSLAGLHRQQLGFLNPPTPKSNCSSLPPSRTASPNPDLQPLTSTSTSTSTNSSTRGCISACNEIIEYLDTQIHSDLSALDAVMRVNKTAATALARILSLPSCRASAACPLLICIAMEQMVTLFECSVRSTSGLPTLAAAMVPDLRFGCFPVEADEMVAVRARLVTQELRRAAHVLDELALALSNPSLRAVPSVALHQQWAADMGARLTGLVVVVDGWRRDCVAGFGRS